MGLAIHPADNDRLDYIEYNTHIPDYLSEFF